MIGILTCLSYPNLVQFFGGGVTKKASENPNEEKIEVLHLSMRLKKLNLFLMLKNLIQFFSCRIIQETNENPMEDEIGEMHLVMEVMDSKLSTILKKTKRPSFYVVVVDIIY